jgi:glucose-6-phosphate isomerase
MEGPSDKVVLFVEVDDHGTDAPIPGRHPEMSEFAYLGGHTLGELLNTERQATAEALRLAGKPNATFYLPRIGPHELGQLFMLLQVATVYAGALYRVDPLDQPGVELSKRLTYGLMGRVGVPRPEMREADPRWRI